uniref:Uncharacterized protein n=1 Tax=Cucumis melo TaxID=3656 RepID=A0A9I9ED92_CUCME
CGCADFRRTSICLVERHSVERLAERRLVVAPFSGCGRRHLPSSTVLSSLSTGLIIRSSHINLSRELFAGTPRKLVVVVGIALIAVYLYASNFPKTIQELHRSKKNDDDVLGVLKPSWSFPFISNRSWPSKLISASLKSDSSVVFSMRGDIYPDGSRRMNNKIAYNVCHDHGDAFICTNMDFTNT